MRTTVTIDPDVSLLLKEEMQRSKKPFKQALNDAVRRGLIQPGSPDRPRFKVRAHDMKLKPGIDPDRLNQLADELETEAILQKLKEGR
jgi:hypothetical protein